MQSRKVIAVEPCEKYKNIYNVIFLRILSFNSEFSTFIKETIYPQ